MSIVPLNGRIVVKPEKVEEQTESGILLTKETVDKDVPEVGLVIEGNAHIQSDCRVVFSRYGFDEVEVDGETYYLVAEHNVLAILK